jgi:hypothetical protein
MSGLPPKYGKAEFEAVRDAVNADDADPATWCEAEGIDMAEVARMAVNIAASYALEGGDPVAPVAAGFEVGYRLAKNGA